jgi:peptidylprolyl isomerase
MGLIPGFIEGIEQMSFGDKFLLYIPSHLGYGEAGMGEAIKPNTDLIFEIEMTETIQN